MEDKTSAQDMQFASEEASRIDEQKTLKDTIKTKVSYLQSITPINSESYTSLQLLQAYTNSRDLIAGSPEASATLGGIIDELDSVITSIKEETKEALSSDAFTAKTSTFLNRAQASTSIYDKVEEAKLKQINDFLQLPQIKELIQRQIEEQNKLAPKKSG